MDNQTLLSLLSKKKLTNMQTKKYMAAYLDRNAKPNTTPRIIKLIKEGSFLIRKNTIKEIIQKNNNTTSVEIKKEDTLTAGIIKKLNAQSSARGFSISNLLHKT